MIQLLNVKAGDLFYHSVIPLFGKCDDYEQFISIGGRQWKIENNYFKGFVKLEYGKNEINLKTTNCAINIILFRLAFNPSIRLGNKIEQHDEPNIVRVLYVVCKDDVTNGEFQSDDSINNKLENAKNRIDLGIKLIQTYISENFYKKFHTRKSFMLKNDINEVKDENVCEIFMTDLSIKEAQAMSSDQLFVTLAKEIKNKLYRQNVKYVALLSFTRYMPQTGTINEDIFKLTKGYCALGAKWLAVYGTPCLFSWAENLDELANAFTNSKLIDTNKLMNDTGFRNTYASCYSTTLGSLLHEFSHILDIGHNHEGIMARGFDDLFSFFTINFEKCFCYSELNQMKLNNFFIERITTLSNETDNKELKIKQSRVKKIAFYRTDYIGILKEVLKRNEIVYSLVYDQKKNDCNDLSRMGKINIESDGQQDFCECMKSCFYVESNLYMLFYSKWLNNHKQIKIAKDENDSLKTDDIYKINSNGQKNIFHLMYHNKSELQVISVNNLAICELRTLSKSFTFDYEIFTGSTSKKSSQSNKKKIDSIACKTLNINFLIVKQKLEDFIAIHEYKNNVTTLSYTEKTVGFELVLLDQVGNVFKKRINFL